MAHRGHAKFFNARYMINYRAINEKLSRYKWETCEVARVWLSRTLFPRTVMAASVEEVSP